MLRPLPPFRVRPLRQTSVRKAGLADLPPLDDDEPITIKGPRRPLRLARKAAPSRLKVLGRDLPN